MAPMMVVTTPTMIASMKMATNRIQKPAFGAVDRLPGTADDELACIDSPPSFGASIAPVSERKPNSAGDRPIESRDGRRGSLPEVRVFQQQGDQSADGRARARSGSDRARPHLRPPL